MLGAAALLAASCVPQTPDDDTYRDRTRQAIDQTVSAVETTRLVLHSLRGGDMLQQYAEVALRDSEDTLSSTSNSYDALDPPPAADGLYSSTSSLMSEASSVVTEARIAVVREDHSQYAKLSRQLAKLSTSLERKRVKVE